MANGYNPQVAPTVLGSGLQPLNILTQQRQQEALNKQRQQVLSQQKQAARDQQIAKHMQFDSGKVWQPYDTDIKNQANTHRNWVAESFRQNPNITSDPRWLAEKQRREGVIKSNASQSEYTKGLHENKIAEIKADKYLKDDYYINKTNNLVFGDDHRTGRKYDDINYNEFGNITNDAKGYDMDVLNRDFVKELPERVEQFYREKEDSFGNKFFDTTQIKANLIQGTKLNRETGTFDVNVNDDVVMMAKQHPYYSRALEQYKQEMGIEDDKQALRQMLGPYAGQAEVKETAGRQISEDAGTRKRRETAEQAGSRYEFVHTGLREGNLATIKAAADLTEGTDLHFEYPDGPPAPGEKLKPNKLIVSWNKFDVEGIPITVSESIDISTEEKLDEAEGILNTLLNKKEVSGSKIGIDDWNAAKKAYRKGKGFKGPAYKTAKGGVYN